MKKLLILPLLSIIILLGSSQIQTNAQDNVDIIMNKTYSLHWDFNFIGAWFNEDSIFYGHYEFRHSIPYELELFINDFNVDFNNSNLFKIVNWLGEEIIPYNNPYEFYDYQEPYFYYYEDYDGVEDAELVIFLNKELSMWNGLTQGEIIPTYGDWTESIYINSWTYTEPDEFTENAYNEGYSDGRASAERDYLDGYTDGYDLGKQDGIGIGYDEGYDDGLVDGMNTTQQDVYNKGYQDGANESFLGNFDKWIVPAIISTLVIGGIIAFRRREYED